MSEQRSIRERLDQLEVEVLPIPAAAPSSAAQPKSQPEKLRRKFTLDFLTDIVALWAVVIIGIGTTAYLSASITPDLWSQIIMGIFGGGLPLISVRFLIKRKRVLFFITAGLIVFSDVSMVLSLTAGQSRSVAASASTESSTPQALMRLQNAADAAQETVNELLRQQSAAKTVAFVGMLQEQIRAAIASRDEAQRLVREWSPPTSVKSERVNSHEVFMAIPAAIASGDLSRWMTLIFAVLLATVYQGTVIATTNAAVKQVRASERQSTPKKKKRRYSRKPKEPVAPTEPAGLDLQDSP